MPLELPPFVLGANLPWIQYGCDFGANAWQPAGGLKHRADLDRIRRHFEALATRGISALRWFMLCDGRAGVRFDPDGFPLGVDEAFFPDVDVAIELTREAGLRVIWVLLDFSWCKPARTVNGVQLGGHRRAIQSASQRRALIDNVLSPVLRRYGNEPVVQAWDLINEPEWITRGVGSWNPFRWVSSAAVRAYLRETAAAVHALTAQDVTVGSARPRWLWLVSDTGLDFYQPHWYEHLERRAPLPSVTELALDRPAWLGEFPARGTTRSAREVVDVARQSGYGGAFVWSLLAGDEWSLTEGTRAAELDALRKV
jgi:hypothetical protein